MAQPEAPLPSQPSANDPESAQDQESHVTGSESPATESKAAEPVSIAKGASPTKPSVSSAPAQPQGKGWRNLALLLVVALVFSGIALANQTKRAAELAGEVTTLGAQLAASKVEIAVYESRMSHVRSELTDVLVKVSLLHEFVSADTSEALSQELAPAHGRTDLLLESPIDSAPVLGATNLE